MHASYTHNLSQATKPGPVLHRLSDLLPILPRPNPYPHLRPDVGAVVGSLVKVAPKESDFDGHREWRAYYRAKRVISGQCGWHAPEGLYDQREYDRAMQAYIEGAGL